MYRKSGKWIPPLVPYFEDVGSPASNLLGCKILFKGSISDASKGLCFIIFDLKDNFLASHMLTSSYMAIQSRFIPPDIYNFHKPIQYSSLSFIWYLPLFIWSFVHNFFGKNSYNLL